MVQKQHTHLGIILGGIRPHQTNFMDDGFSAEKNGASERIFFPQKMERAKKRQFKKKKRFPAKIGRPKKQIFFSKKQTEENILFFRATQNFILTSDRFSRHSNIIH